jgi:hypothetical protein
MEAVRLRKENQIYSADEKRALAMFRLVSRIISRVVLTGGRRLLDSLHRRIEAAG